MQTQYPAPWHVKLYNRIDNVAGRAFCRLFGCWFVWTTETDCRCSRCHLYVSVHDPAVTPEHFAAVVDTIRRRRAVRTGKLRPAPR